MSAVSKLKNFDFYILHLAGKAILYDIMISIF